MPSHKSSTIKARPVQAPQRSNGKLRVAAILDAAAAAIAEKGYEAATMAEIAARSGTKIGSLYRFFPNKESLGDTIIVSARENFDVVFDKFDAEVKALTIRALADNLLALLSEQVFSKPALLKLLDASEDWSVKREEFRIAVVRRIAKTLTIYSSNLPKKSAGDLALVILSNTKAMATTQKLPDSGPRTLDEFRDMTRLYLQSRLGSSISAKKRIPSSR
jgi:AcrR family transcriptional regulator